MPAAEFVLIYSTFPDRDSAISVCELLVKSRLAACANISAPMISVYAWQDELTRAEEIAVLIKTRASLADAAIDAARQVHPYTTPCFLTLAVEGGNAQYLDWLRQQTQP
ncbi:MAG: divalent-cation tolerance protein CutA [Alphaproteobacteria bacterium]|nr:divalent-cation tolerance protein CutA [Alphaproteobacteria bacterium]